MVVDFTAKWCGPCKLIMPLLESLAKENPEVTFLKVDVDELASVAEECEIKAMPTILFFKEGKLLHKIVGGYKTEITKKVAELSALWFPTISLLLFLLSIVKLYLKSNLQ